MSTGSATLEKSLAKALAKAAALATLTGRMGEGRALALTEWIEKSQRGAAARKNGESESHANAEEALNEEPAQERARARADIKKSESWKPLLKMAGLVLLSFAGKGLHGLGAKKAGMAIVEKTLDALALAEKEADLNNVDAVIAAGSKAKLNKTFCEICLTSPRNWEARAAQIAASPLFDPFEPAYESWFQVNPFVPGAKRGESVTPLAALAMGASSEKRLVDPQKLKLLADVVLSRAERVELGQWVHGERQGRADVHAFHESHAQRESDIAFDDAPPKPAHARRL